MKVVEIFRSIDGEGKRTGLPTTFIRLFGCNLHCSYCDTRYGCEGNNYDVMSIREIVEECRLLEVKNVTITGGEPLIHPGIKKLIEALLCAGYYVNVETNGSINVDDFRSQLHPGGNDGVANLFFTVDYKCPSSGMESKMDLESFRNLRRTDVLKFVVGSKEDMDAALSVLDQIGTSAEVYFSPVFGKIEPAEIVEYITEHKLFNCKVQVQLHKIIWSPTTRGV